MNSPNTQKIQQKMANRVQYLKFLSKNKNAYMSEIAAVEKSIVADDHLETSNTDL